MKRRIIFCACILLARLAHGQTAQLSGLVSDATRAVIHGATVDLRNEATGVHRSATANEAGIYTLSALKPGSYQATVTATGFRTATRSNIRLEVEQQARIDFEMEIGTIEQSVEVNGNAVLLDSDNSAVTTVVNRQLLDRVPFQLGGTSRDVTSFVRLVPGVASGAGNFGINITGGRQHASEILVDGVPNTYRGALNTPFSVRPSMTSVSEFRVEAAVPPAEFGHTSSGVVIMTTKSGTNQLHGNFELVIRNNVLSARSYNAATADVTRQGEGAISIGGPVWLPKLYDGRNRTFFFFDYTLFRRINQPQGVLRTVGTDSMRNGDFSGLAPIFDPLTGGAGEPRLQFPGNRIPVGRVSSFARAMLQVIPGPNLPTQENNFTGSQRNIENMTVPFVRIDHHFNDKQQVSTMIRFNYNERNNFNGPWTERLEGFHDKPASPHLAVNHDWILRPNLLNQAKVGYTTWFSNFLQTPGISYQVPGSFGPGFPVVSFSGNGLSTIGENLDRTVGSKTVHLEDAVSWTHGTHNSKFGFRFDYQEDNTQTLGDQNGTYKFSPFASGQPGRSETGNAFASFLLGAPTSAEMQIGLPLLARSNVSAFFAQDDWRATRSLTINYGVRYEWQQPWHDRDGNMSNFDPHLPNPAAGNLPGAMIFAGKGPGRLGGNELVRNYWGGIGPRLGLAYQMGPKTVLRAGAAIFYAPRRYAQVITQGYSSSVAVSSLDGGATPAFYLDHGWPAGLAVKPPSINPTFANGQDISYLNPSGANGSGRLGRTFQSQIGVQRRLGSGLMEVNWVSTQGRHLPNSTLDNLNQVPSQYLSLGSLLTRDITDPAVLARGFSAPFTGFRGTLAQALRPFPQYESITFRDSTEGNSSYNGLLAKYEQRFTNGLTILASYTFSKLLSDVELQAGANALLQDAGNRGAERSVVNFDAPHRFISSFAYDLPFGHGARWFSRGRLANTLAGGWSISGIISYESGKPLQITIPNGMPIFNGQLRPNLVGGVNPFLNNDSSSFRPLNQLSGERGDLMLNRAAFAIPAPYTFGNLAPFVAQLRKFGAMNEDITLAKRFQTGEKQFLEVRTDWFNAFNRRNLNGPVTDLTSVDFGRIIGQLPARVIQIGVRFAF